TSARTTLPIILSRDVRVTVARTSRERIIGSVVRADVVDSTSPIAYGYGDQLSVYCFNGPAFDVSNVAGRGGFRRLGPETNGRPTGRGTLSDPDFVVGRQNEA